MVWNPFIHSYIRCRFVTSKLQKSRVLNNKLLFFFFLLLLHYILLLLSLPINNKYDRKIKRRRKLLEIELEKSGFTQNITRVMHTFFFSSCILVIEYPENPLNNLTDGEKKKNPTSIFDLEKKKKKREPDFFFFVSFCAITAFYNLSLCNVITRWN